MKKYYLMAINKGNYNALNNLDIYYESNLSSDEDLQNYFNSFVGGIFKYKIKYFSIFGNRYVEEYRIINIFCLGINNIYLNIEDFKFCLYKIVNYINSRGLCESCGLKNMKHFVKYINKLRYCIKNKLEFKKCTNKIFAQYASQIFMEYLDLYYHKYLKKISSPKGKDI